MSSLGRVLVFDAYGEEIADADVHRTGHPQAVVVSAPGYIERRALLDFNATSVDEIVLWMNPKTAIGPPLLDACEKNLAAAMQEMNIWNKTEGKPIIRKQDRCYWRVPRGTDLRRYLDYYHYDRWHAVSGGLHDPWEPGWEQAGSWKTRRGAPDLQVTLWEREGKDVAEVDLDLATGAKHILEAIGNEVSGSLTHPYMVNQLLAVEWGITAFKLEANDE